MKKISTLIAMVTMLSMLVFVFGGCTSAGSTSEQNKTSDKAQSSQVAESTSPAKSDLKIGFAQLGTTDAWRIAETKSMKAEAEKRGYNFIMTDAQNSTEKQVADVEDLIAQGVDYLFLAPIEFEGLVPALEAAKKANVPVILIDRAAKGTAGVDYVTLISSDFIWEGEQAANWLAKSLGEKGNIIELTGTAGASAAQDRASGFYKGLEKYPNMKVISSQTANFVRAEAQKVMENIIQSVGKDFDAVYCHSDEMALGAILAMKAAGIKVGKDGVKVVGVDGEKEALESIIAGELSASVSCSPMFGPAAFDTLEKIMAGEKVETRIVNPDTVLDITNAETELPNSF